jgi:hypothetical protein
MAVTTGAGAGSDVGAYDDDLAAIARVKLAMAQNADVMRVCLVAERALLHPDGSRRFDRITYMRRYMRQYRRAKKAELEEP